MIRGLIMTGKYPSACIQFIIGPYTLSLANDTSCNKDGIIRRSSICIYRNGDNVTSEFYPNNNELFGVNSKTVFEVMSILNQNVL